MGAVTALLHTLKQCLAAEPEVVAGPPAQPSLTEQLLMVLEAVLVEACEMPAADYAELVGTIIIHDSPSNKKLSNPRHHNNTYYKHIIQRYKSGSRQDQHYC